jgi:hypothetical protein
VNNPVAVIVALMFVATPLARANAKVYKRHAQRHPSPDAADNSCRKANGWVSA